MDPIACSGSSNLVMRLVIFLPHANLPSSKLPLSVQDGGGLSGRANYITDHCFNVPFNFTLVIFCFFLFWLTAGIAKLCQPFYALVVDLLSDAVWLHTSYIQHQVIITEPSFLKVHFGRWLLDLGSTWRINPPSWARCIWPESANSDVANDLNQLCQTPS